MEGAMSNKYLTWNVNGLNSPQKRRKVFHYLKQSRCDVICLQETHIRNSDQKYLINNKLGSHFVAAAPEKKNGIVIYIKSKIPAKLIEADPQGRYLALELRWEGKIFLLMGIYAPNQQQGKFYKLLHKKIIEYGYRSSILMGDWNGVINTMEDKKKISPNQQLRAKLPKAFFDIMDDLEMRDIWRERNYKVQDYTFYSDRHQSFSRIDFILVSSDFLASVKKIKILSRVISDHNPVWMEIGEGGRSKRSWRLNENLFRYEANVTECKKVMKEFFEFNMNKGTSMGMVWDASKAYMRGILINLNKRYRCNKEKKRKELEVEIKQLEQELIMKPGDKTVKEGITILRKQFDLLMAEQVASNLQYMKFNTFANANKPGRWMAYMLRKKQKSRMIEKIEYKGKEVFQQELIKKAFLEYYTKLYTEENIKEGEIDKYLQNEYVSVINRDQRENLNLLITSEEILTVIKQLKMGKSPGTDGLTSTYYKHLQTEVVEPLKELFCNIQKGGEIPPSWKSAFISLIPKEGQDNTQTKNYRPISLLNTDYKIFAKVMANRLMPVLQHIIHSDQTGFIQGRHMKGNARQIINILEYLEKNNQVSAMLMFLDAEKAFDRLNWLFLKKLLQKMQMGEHFITSIQAIYQEQMAQVIINGNLTESFKIEKGTRQGCPLSPLLFILTLEVLLNKIRNDENIQGIKIKQQDYRIRAFADDLVVTLTQPNQSAKALMNIINKYGQVSGFKINIGKTKMIVKNTNSAQRQTLEQVTGCEIVKKVKYLGIYIEASNNKLYKNNYDILWNKVQKDLDNWKKLQLSLLGRIAAIKMNILPKFLFLFQMIPILKNDRNLEEWQKGLNKFVWNGKKPRVKLKIIQDSRERGGLKMPNLKLYYDAAVLTMVSDWINLTKDRIVNTEGYDLLCGWHAYLIYDKKVDKKFKNHVLRNAMLRVWKKYQYKLKGKVPLWTVPRHTIENINTEQKHDTFTYKELLNKEGNIVSLKSMDTLRNERVINTWFQYAQLQNRWDKDQKCGILQMEDNLIKQIRDQGPTHIKRIYNVLIETDSEKELVKDCMVKWGQNFDELIAMETWEKIWVRNVKFTQAQSLRENFYKMFYRWHLDPKKLSCMYKNVQAKCWRCDSMDATYYHIWWTCKKIKAFWIKIWWILQNVLKKRIKFTPQLFLLGIIEDCTVIETNLILNLITAARLLVGQYWKKEELPSIEEWTLKVTGLAEMAKISAYLKGHSNEKYVKDWIKWTDYMQGKYRLKKLYMAYS